MSPTPLAEARSYAQRHLKHAVERSDLDQARAWLGMWELLEATSIEESAAPADPVQQPNESATVLPLEVLEPAVDLSVEVPAEEAPSSVVTLEPEPAAEPPAPEQSQTEERPQAAELPKATVPATPRPSERPQRPLVEEALRAWCERVLEVLDDKHERTPEWTCRIKSLMCQGNALHSKASYYGLDGVLNDELGRLAEETPGTFIAVRRAKRYSDEDWRALAEAFAGMELAERAIAFLESDPPIGADERKPLVMHAAAAQSMVYRWFHRRTITCDKQAQDLKTRIEALQGDQFYIPWWNTQDTSDEKVAESAKGLPKLLQALEGKVADYRVKHNKGAQCREALERVAKMFQSDNVSPDSFASDLCKAVDGALEAGVPPSNKELRNLLEGYLSFLDGLQHAQGKKLRENLQKDADLRIAKHQVLADDDPESEDGDELLREVVSLVEGKRMLFVGGNKGQTHRIPDYKKRLKLADFQWPDMEPDGKPTTIRPMLEKHDIVVYVIRFSRHAYKSLLDEAKELGKATITLPRGLGFNTLVRELHAQLPRPANGA